MALWMAGKNKGSYQFVAKRIGLVKSSRTDQYSQVINPALLLADYINIMIN